LRGIDPITVAAERGGIVESRHRVHAVAVHHGQVVEAYGDPDLVTFMRSAAKPLQALPLALAAPDLPEEEIAIASASHEARADQLRAAGSLLARAGRIEDDLECGPENGSKLRHNCSGKHAGMLLLCRLRGWPHEGYRLPEHPLQQEILALVAEAVDHEPDRIPTAVDGCGVVTFGLPLHAMALAFSRLATGQLDGAGRVVEAMLRRPELVGGPDASDTSVMRARAGAIAKRGAEGLLSVGLQDGTGVALKVEDGSNRAVLPAAGLFLGIPALAEIPLENSRRDVIGMLKAVL
jgi:L-asparaginase II